MRVGQNRPLRNMQRNTTPFTNSSKTGKNCTLLGNLKKKSFKIFFSVPFRGLCRGVHCTPADRKWSFYDLRIGLIGHIGVEGDRKGRHYNITYRFICSGGACPRLIANAWIYNHGSVKTDPYESYGKLALTETLNPSVSRADTSPKVLSHVRGGLFVCATFSVK